MTSKVSLTSQQRKEYRQIIGHLQSEHVRITESRKAIIAYIISSKDHPSAEMIYHDLIPKYPGMSLATVYNNLKLLVDEGYVTEIKKSSDATTYFDYMGHDHLNIICEKCGKVVDLDIHAPSLQDQVQAVSGFSITREIHTLYGVCKDCQAAS